MSKIHISNKELEKHTNILRQTISGSLISIHGIRKSISAPPIFIGTALLCRYGKTFFVLSAQHVFEGSEQYEHIFHGFGHGETAEMMVPLRGGWVGHPDKDMDVAIWGTFEKLYEGKDVRVLTFSELASYHSDNDLFLCCGFPGEKHMYFAPERTARTMDNTVVSKSKLPSVSINSDIHFSFSYPSNVDPRGMSGSPVWLFNYRYCNSSDIWDPSIATFAGVAQRWDQKESVLIASKASKIIEWLPGAVMHMRKVFDYDIHEA